MTPVTVTLRGNVVHHVTDVKLLAGWLTFTTTTKQPRTYTVPAGEVIAIRWEAV